jgi:hypothetical protein
MSLKKNPLKLFVIVFVLVLVFGIGGSVFLRNYKERNSPEKFSATVSETYDTFPQILNEPVRSIAVGSDFSFSPRIVPMDDSVSLKLLDSPGWLILNDMLLGGSPDAVGSFSFVLRLEKDGKYIDEEFFLVVTDEVNE